MSETSPVEIAKNFKLNVLKLIDYLIDILESDSDLLMVRFVVKNLSQTTMIEKFHRNVQSHRNEIESSNEDYFMDVNNTIFDDFGEKVLKFKTFWKKLSNDQQTCIWKYFKYFLRLSDRYNTLVYTV